MPKGVTNCFLVTGLVKEVYFRDELSPHFSTMKQLVFLLALLALSTAQSQETLNELYLKSKTAAEAENYIEFKRLNLQMLEIHPSQPTVLFNTVQACIHLKQKDSALYYLNKYISWNTEAKWEELKNVPAAWNLPTAIRSFGQRYHTAREIGFEIASFLRQRHLEDLKLIGDTFYVTDLLNNSLVSKSLDTDQTNTSYTFSNSPIALALDQTSNHLWVSIGNILGRKSNEEGANTPWIYEIDLSNSTLISQIQLPEGALVGSMVWAEGQLYASNSAKPEVFIVDPKAKKITDTLVVEIGYNLQGITYNPQKREIYVADYISGILAIPLEDPSAKKWFRSDSFLLKGIDGMTYLGDNQLLIIQNNSSPKRLAKLNFINHVIVSAELLENNLDYSGEPTNLTLDSEGNVYYIANSAWPFYDKEMQPQKALWKNQVIRKIPASSVKKN